MRMLLQIIRLGGIFVKKSKWIQMILVLIYIIGVGFTVHYGITFCMHNTYVANPDAMLPFTEYERALIMMAFGCPFMVASVVSIVWCYDLRHTKHAKRNMFLVSLPAIVDLIPFVFAIVFLVFLILEGYLETLGIIP